MRIPIAQFNQKGKCLGVFSAINRVSEAGIDPDNARKVVIGQRLSAGGYTFRALSRKESAAVVNTRGENFGFVSAKTLMRAGISLS